MTTLDIVHQRLDNQRIALAPFEKPEEAVKWLGAVQAQDYPAAKWAVGLRLKTPADSAVERAFSEGAILRTHILRPTWHFVTPADIRWMLALTAPRVHALSAYYYHKLEIDEALVTHSNAVLVKSLEGGKQLTRPELAAILKQESIDTDNLLRSTYIIG